MGPRLRDVARGERRSPMRVRQDRERSRRESKREMGVENGSCRDSKQAFTREPGDPHTRPGRSSHESRAILTRDPGDPHTRAGRSSHETRRSSHESREILTREPGDPPTSAVVCSHECKAAIMGWQGCRHTIAGWWFVERSGRVTGQPGSLRRDPRSRHAFSRRGSEESKAIVAR